MNKPSKWHFSRADLADSYLKQLDAGLNSIAIFAERRKGKTEFLLDDLEPRAKALKFRTVYVNFWERKSDPVYCITQGVRRALEADSPRLLQRWKKEFTLKLGAVQIKTSIDPNKYPELASEALDILLSVKGQVLLMFDEIQHLATDPSFEDLIATLRTFLDSNKRKVKCVFTGSSQDRLNKIFRNQKSAFYRGASLVEFPDMGENFSNFLVNTFYNITKRKLSSKRALAIFTEYHHSPFTIVDILQTMLREGIFDFDKGIEYYLQINKPSQEWKELWGSLKLIDQLLLLHIIIHAHPLYHSNTYKLIGEKLGIEKVSRGVIQSSIKRLRGQGVLNNEGRGQWSFESNEFRGFVLNL